MDDGGIAWKLLAGAGAALTALATWAWNHTHSRIKDMDDTKADRNALCNLVKKVEEHMITKEVFDQHLESDEKQLGAIDSELSVQRGHIAKIFDKLEDVRATIHAQHVEIINAIHEATQGRRK